jgi:hypothetical protein
MLPMALTAINSMKIPSISGPKINGALINGSITKDESPSNPPSNRELGNASPPKVRTTDSTVLTA